MGIMQTKVRKRAERYQSPSSDKWALVSLTDPAWESGTHPMPMGITQIKVKKRDERYQSPEEWALVGLTDPAWDTSYAIGNHAVQGKEEDREREVPEPSPEEWVLVGITEPRLGHTPCQWESHRQR